MCNLAVVYDGMDILKDVYQDMFDSSIITIRELNYILKIVECYWQFLYSDAHGVAYLLHPGFIGERMSIELHDQVFDFITKHPVEAPSQWPVSSCLSIG